MKHIPKMLKSVTILLIMVSITTPPVNASDTPIEYVKHGERHFTFASDHIIYGTVNYYIDVTFTIHEDHSIVHTDETLAYMPMKSIPTNYSMHGMTLGYDNQSEMYETAQEWDIAYNFQYYGPQVLQNNDFVHLVHPYPAISNITLYDHYRINGPILNAENNPWKTYILSAPALNTTLQPGVIYKKIREVRVNVTDPEVYYLNYFYGFKVNFYDGTTFDQPAPEGRVFGLGDFHTLLPSNSSINLMEDLIFTDLPYRVNEQEAYSKAELDLIRDELEESMSERLYVVDSLEAMIDDLENTVAEQSAVFEHYDELQLEYETLSADYDALQSQLEDLQNEENNVKIPGFPLTAIIIGVILSLLVYLTRKSDESVFHFIKSSMSL